MRIVKSYMSHVSYSEAREMSRLINYVSVSERMKTDEQTVNKTGSDTFRTLHNILGSTHLVGVVT